MERHLIHLNLDPDTYDRIQYATEKLKRQFGRPMLGYAAVVTDLVQKHLAARPPETNCKKKKPKPPTA